MSEAFATANRITVGDTIGAVMNGRWERLRIVGIALSPEYIYEIRPSEVFPDNRRFGVLWIGREPLSSAFNMKTGFNDVAISLSRGTNPANIISALDRMLDRYGCLGAYDRSDQVSFRFLTDELGELRAYGVILPTLFLGIVAFLLNVLLSRLVASQRTQIAVLKAFGYTNLEIGLHYLEFSLVAVAAGVVVGIASGLWLASAMMSVYARYFHFPALQLQINSSLILFAVILAGACACVGALTAVRKAVALAPAEAMRPESPIAFRPGLIERIGLTRFFGAVSRMIMRNLDRRRARASLAALAVALSVAIVVAGRYSIDAVNRLVEIQFETIQRDDATVLFQEARPERAAHNIASLPGVLQVEAYREVPVRLRFGHRSRRVPVLGLSPEADLRFPVDQHLNSIRVPPDGLVLNMKLAQILHANPGDSIRMEVLEGARPIRDILVVGTVDEPVGLGAYMDAAALHRFMREAAVVSGARLKVDPNLAPRLYSTLKRTPAVSGIGIRGAMLASFWKTFGESIWISTAFLVGFASVIAFGVVYNGIRIALSERGNELACLRVLGYTRAEAWRILMGEQGLLILVAIPAGFLLGLGLSVLLSQFFSRELFRLPLVVNAATYAFAAMIVTAAAVFSGVAVAGRLRRMDLTQVLKSRE